MCIRDRVNETMCLDTGCVFGGHLTALRWPEREVVQVPAERVWYEPSRPFPTADPDSLSGTQARVDPTRGREDLDLTDVLGPVSYTHLDVYKRQAAHGGNPAGRQAQYAVHEIR